MSYLCQECGFQCLSQIQLKNHKKSVHDKRSFNCHECEHQCYGLNCFKNHQRVHENITCVSCNKIVSKKSQYAHELKCLQRKKMYKCIFCVLIYMLIHISKYKYCIIGRGVSQYLNFQNYGACLRFVRRMSKIAAVIQCAWRVCLLIWCLK